MEVPFISSGALSRAHYALVRKIETAGSIPAADQVLLAEIEAIRERLSRSKLTEKQTKESLILLLYCSMNISLGLEVNIDFALPHAVNLAEAGQTVQNKRTGYMYCSELMPKEHELQLMLVNTLRKDLEALAVPRICLALEVLIQSPSEDIIPAVQDRLYELLAHDSLHVRRRALYAFRALSTLHRDIMERVMDNFDHRLRDSKPSVVVSALSVCRNLLETGLLSTDKLRGALDSLLEETWRHRADPSKRTLLIKILDTLRLVRPTLSVCKQLINIVRTCSAQKSSANVVLQQCFLAAGTAGLSDLLAAQRDSNTTWVDNIRHLLVSPDMNDIYSFLVCLGCMDPKLWAGTTPDIAAVLEGWEVERVMQLLDSPDSSIRVKTLRILCKVDLRIVETYYKQTLEADRTLATPEELLEASKRLMETLDVLSNKDGEDYAHGLMNIISSLASQSSSDTQMVLQNVVEEVLLSLREALVDFRGAFLGVFFALIDNVENALRPTAMIIAAALICEYVDSSPVPPPRLLQALFTRLPSYNAAIQEACLVAMIRLIALCEAIPEGAVAVARKVQEQGGRHIRRRCEQFLNLSHSRTIVQHIVGKSKSNSLPDFLMALETYEAHKVAQAAASPTLSSIPSPERPSSRASSSASHAPAKLRYSAYDAPKLATSLRIVRSRSPFSDRSGSSRFINDHEDPMSHTVTAGDLALASGHIELQTLTKSPQSPSTPPRPSIQIKDDLAARMDLIALDSPFIADPPAAPAAVEADFDFKETWDRFAKANMRGWCEAPVEAVVRKLQGMDKKMRLLPTDQAPFFGDLKIVIHGTNESNLDEVALLRLKEGEDDSCMWHMRYEDSSLKDAVGLILKEI